jgi:beta-xylosidase
MKVQGLIPILLALSLAYGQSPAVIFNGDFPDPTILRDGGDFYLTHSSFNYVPGLLIWHSTDLYRWRPVARALSRHVGNVWAPDLVKHNGLYYIYFPAGGTNWVIRAKSPSGPWSDPLDLKIEGIDPGHIASPDGKRYLYLNRGEVYELAPDGLSVKGGRRKVYEGWPYPEDWAVECFCLESPKLTFRKGSYYLTSAQGGTFGPSTSHMVVAARSKSPLGPWENSPYNPIVRTWSRSEPWWSKGHGTLFEKANDEWFLLYHAIENGARRKGRQTLIEPAVWKEDGWFLPRHPDRDRFRTQTYRNWEIASDDFTAPALGLQWQFDGIETLDEFRLDDGKLRFETEAGKRKLLLLPVSDADFEVAIRLEAEEDAEAGLLLYQSTGALLGIGLKNSEVVSPTGSTYRYADRIECKGCRHLKYRFQQNEMTLSFSQDGVRWRRFPRAFDVGLFPEFGSLKIAIYGYGKGAVIVDRFDYRSLGGEKR